MGKFTDQRFCKSILDLAQVYGPYQFWIHNFAPGSNPDATWRALMVVAALNDHHLSKAVQAQLRSVDSRVRAWACTAVAALNDQTCLTELFRLTHDLSCRVRYRAREAIFDLNHRSINVSQRPQQGKSIGNVVTLISEDADKIRMFYEYKFSQMGYQPHVASTETDSISLAKKVHPALILTDNQKGRDNLSGLNMTWDICRSTELRESLVFMVTADRLEPAFLWYGGDEFFTKPLDINQLDQVLCGYFN